MGGILMALVFGMILGAVLAPRYLIPWVRWRWPDFAKAVFGALLLMACVTESIPAQTVDTTGWRYTDSVPTAWRYTDSTPILDTLPPPADTTQPAPGKHPHLPANMATLWDNDFAQPIGSVGKYVLAGRAGCWYANGGAKIANGKYLVTYPVGFLEGRTPAKLEAYPAGCRTAKPVTALYVHLTGYQPGDGTPAWVNGAGNKALFIDYGGSKFVFKCDDPLPATSGVRTYCLWTLHTPAGLAKGTGRGVVIAGQPNDIECVVELAKAACWVNGSPLTWATGPGAPMLGVWHDWTYGGGGGGVPVGVRSVWSLEGSFGAGR